MLLFREDDEEKKLLPSNRTTTNRLVVITNVPTPYRIPFFNTLQEVLMTYDIELFVLYCALREPHRHWELPLGEQKYKWQILPGLHPSIQGWYPHVNPSVVMWLQSIDPRWLLVAGAWNTPTMLIAMQKFSAPNAFRIFWSEGHQDAVLHRSGIIAYLRRFVLRGYDAFAVPNDRSMNFMYNQIRKQVPIFRLANTIDEDFFCQAKNLDVSAIRSRLGISEESVVFTTVAQLEQRKGVLELVAGYSQLSQDEQRRTTLILVGDGSLRNRLIQEASDISTGQVLILGHLSKDDVREVLAASNLFILPTRQDPNPLSVIEAAFAGLPIVVSQKAGNATEIVREGENGWILENINATAIATAMRDFLYTTTHQRDLMGSISLTIANRQFRRYNVAHNFVADLVNTFPVPK